MLDLRRNSFFRLGGSLRPGEGRRTATDTSLEEKRTGEFAIREEHASKGGEKREIHIPIPTWRAVGKRSRKEKRRGENKREGTKVPDE